METIKATLNDKKTWDLICSPRILGIFQIDGPAYAILLKNLKIRDFSTLVDSTALIRPGTSDAKTTDVYVNRANKIEEVTYDHPLLEPLLKDTNGIILFQEQCLSIANRLAGYTLAEADLFRKAISAKKPEILQKEREKFVTGCKTTNGIASELGNRIFDQIVTFAGYAFNKSHSVCYALISYWTAYLKANYPLEYMTSLLAVQKTEEDIRKYIRETKDLNLKIGPPDINESLFSFSISESQDDTIVFGLSKIKGVGIEAAEHVVSNRPYSGFIDFISKTSREIIDSRAIEAFIKVGCFRKIEKNFSTKQLLENYLQILGIFKKNKHISSASAAKRQLKTWESKCRVNKQPLEYSLLELANLEREKMGFFISTHPMRHLKSKNIIDSKKYVELGRMRESPIREFYTVGILVDKIRTKKSRRGIIFHELEIEDEQNLLKLPIFGNAHQAVLDTLQPGDAIAIKSKRFKDRLYTEKIRKLEFE